MEEPTCTEQPDLSVQESESSEIPIALAVDDSHPAEARSAAAASHHAGNPEEQDTSDTADEPQDLPPETQEAEPTHDTVTHQVYQDNSESQFGHDSTLDTSELSYTATEGDTQDDDASSVNQQRRHSLRTEALIQAAARAVVSMRQDGGDSQHGDDDGDSTHNSHYFEEHDNSSYSRPDSSASDVLMSPTAESSVGGRTYSSSRQGTEDDLFSVRSPLSSRGSAYDRCDNDAYENMTEKGSDSPQVRSRVASGVSVSGASAMSDFSRLSRYEKEEFVPTSRGNRPAFRSPSAVRALQMSSPAPSVTSASSRTAKVPNGFPTVSRIGSPAAIAQHPAKGRTTPSRFRKEEAPLVLLHVTLLPLRWAYGDVLDHFEARKSAPGCFSSEGMKNLRGAWRQVQDRLGDTVLERGILLPHPQGDYEVLEERLLEALELPLRRRARILECGHYLGPSNNTSASDDGDSDYECMSDDEGSDNGVKEEKKHWCTTCKGDIRYEQLGSERIFRIKVYASNGLMSPGAWEACWKEMERVDIEVEPIVDRDVQSDISTLSAVLDEEQQQRLEAEQNQQLEDEQRMQLEVEQRLSLEQERQELEAQRQKFEEERRQALQETERRLEEERRKLDEEQRQRLEEERRQQFEEDRRLLEAQRQQFEEQRIELEEQRKLIEEEQRQHLEESRRRELEDEHRILDEQRQELEEARQKFEEEQRQQMTSPRPTSRTSYVEDDATSRSRDGAMSTELGPRRRDTERLREIYGNNVSSSDGFPNQSSPSIHIHVDSKREDQNSRQLTLAAPRDDDIRNEPVQEARRSETYAPPPPPLSPPPPAQAYHQAQPPRRSLDAASLPELLGETIRVLLQDPKNVAIAVLVVALAMLAGGFGVGQQRIGDVYAPQQRYQSHQMEAREPAAQIYMNTPPAVQQVQSQWSAPPPVVETIYKTVTAEPAHTSTVTRDVEVVYQTVTKHAPQETPTRLVETIYSTVTESLAMPPIQNEQSESPSPPATSMDPSLAPFDYLDAGSDSVVVVDTIPAPPFTPAGSELFACPMLSFVPGLDSDEGNLKIDTLDGTELEVSLQELDAADVVDSKADQAFNLDEPSPLSEVSEGIQDSAAEPLSQELVPPVAVHEEADIPKQVLTEYVPVIEDVEIPLKEQETRGDLGWFLGPYVDICRPMKSKRKGLKETI